MICNREHVPGAALAHRLLEGLAETEEAKARYTPKQGQYLSFIHYYTKIHGLPRRKPTCNATSG